MKLVSTFLIKARPVGSLPRVELACLCACRRLLGEGKAPGSCTFIVMHNLQNLASVGTFFEFPPYFLDEEEIVVRRSSRRCNVWMGNVCCSLGAWLCSALCVVHWNVRFGCWESMLIFESVWTLRGDWIMKNNSDDGACFHPDTQ